MRKIGIAIKPTVSGNYHPVTINEGEWSRRIRDVRPALLHFPAMQSDHKLIAKIIFFDEYGCYIILARTITDNDLENIAGWIHIPHDLQITSAQLEEIIKNIRRLVSLSEMPDKEYLKNLFGNRQYPVRRNALHFGVSPRNGMYAKRSLTQNGNLTDLLGGNFYIPEYSKYEAVLIEEFPDEVSDAVDISAVCDAEQRFVASENRRKAEINKKWHNESPLHRDTIANKPIIQNPPLSPHATEDYVSFGTPSQSFMQKNWKGLIIGFAVGIVAGILIMFPFTGAGEKDEPGMSAIEADTASAVMADSAVTEVFIDSMATDTSAIGGNQTLQAEAPSSRAHRSHRDRSAANPSYYYDYGTKGLKAPKRTLKPTPKTEASVEKQTMPPTSTNRGANTETPDERPASSPKGRGTINRIEE